jgi:hypothetical protein
MKRRPLPRKIRGKKRIGALKALDVLKKKMEASGIKPEPHWQDR